jgi:hypothetical protein
MIGNKPARHCEVLTLGVLDSGLLLLQYGAFSLRVRWRRHSDEDDDDACQAQPHGSVADRVHCSLQWIEKTTLCHIPRDARTCRVRQLQVAGDGRTDAPHDDTPPAASVL